MRTDLSQETRHQLQRYINGDLSNAELADWLSAVEYDLDLPQAERDILAGISLVLVEVEEGRRGVPEILGVVSATLASSADEAVTLSRSGSETSWEGTPNRTTTEARVQRVGISPGTAFS